MNDPVLRVLMTRQALADEGFSRSLLLSGAGHATTFFAFLILTLLAPSRKIINVIDGFAVPLPRGGGVPRPPAPTEAPADPVPAAPAEPPKVVTKPSAPVKLIKPETIAPKKGLAPVDLKRSVKEPKKSESREIAKEKVAAASPTQSVASPPPVPTSAATGLDFTAQMPGVLNGTTAPTGPLSFYLAAAQNKIWAAWSRQIRTSFSGSVKIAFTIHRDGSVDQVEVLESSGSVPLDRLAERAVLSTQLGPLPNAYEKEILVVHANFKPLS